jgi:hypothetical protein
VSGSIQASCVGACSKLKMTVFAQHTSTHISTDQTKHIDGTNAVASQS